MVGCCLIIYCGYMDCYYFNDLIGVVMIICKFVGGVVLVLFVFYVV